MITLQKWYPLYKTIPSEKKSFKYLDVSKTNLKTIDNGNPNQSSLKNCQRYGQTNKNKAFDTKSHRK